VGNRVTASQVIEVSDDNGIVAARQAVRNLAERLGFGGMDQSRIATAVSELARNLVRYATDSRGTVRITEVRNPAGAVGIEIVVEDQGPGIEDIELAMRQGYSTGKGLGLGLSGTKRLMDEMTLESTPGIGTTVKVRKWVK
jgi:serine/threonine-protein kinase RsbT